MIAYKHILLYNKYYKNKYRYGDNNMFNDIGNKIKGLAKFLAYACIIVGVLAIIIGLVNYAQNADCLEYASAYGGSSYRLLTESGNKAYLGITMMKYGAIYGICGFLSTWPLYGFGELIEKVDSINSNLKKMIENNNNQE